MKAFINFNDLKLHDCKIYAMAFSEDNFEFILDVDYITKWLFRDDRYVFDISPSTFVFKNAWGIEMDISMNTSLTIDYINRENPTHPRNIDYLPKNSTEYNWTIELLQGKIILRSVGLKIYQRESYYQKNTQTLSLSERGDVSFSKEGKELIII